MSYVQMRTNIAVLHREGRFSSFIVAFLGKGFFRPPATPRKEGELTSVTS